MWLGLTPSRRQKRLRGKPTTIVELLHPQTNTSNKIMGGRVGEMWDIILGGRVPFNSFCRVARLAKLECEDEYALRAG